jgi:hypothetical protein
MAKFPFGHLVPGRHADGELALPAADQRQAGDELARAGPEIHGDASRSITWYPGSQASGGLPHRAHRAGPQAAGEFPFGHIVPGHKFMAKFPFAHIVPGHKHMAKFPFGHIVPGHKFMANWIWPHTKTAAT